MWYLLMKSLSNIPCHGYNVIIFNHLYFRFKDVAATTFMATATTIPEFFANTISTFIAESDMG